MGKRLFVRAGLSDDEKSALLRFIIPRGGDIITINANSTRALYRVWHANDFSMAREL